MLWPFAIFYNPIRKTIRMVSFYPGPSRIYDEIPTYVKDAAKEGVLSMNHRSPEFEVLAKKTAALFRKKLAVPANYTVLYTSSATECWEIIAQSLITDKSYHFFNGAFGKKWFEYTVALNKNAEALLFSREEKIEPADFSFPNPQATICLTQNETSNGTQLDDTTLKKFRKRNPAALIAVDATSSMAGVQLDFKQADVWFASVQKCFGLPAGLAVMICSPKAVERAKAVQEKVHYNSLATMISMMEKWQTTHTPNVMGIYLLMRILENSDGIVGIHKRTLERYKKWETFAESSGWLKPLIENRQVRSYTVLPLYAEVSVISSVKSKAKKAGFLLGEGYGDLKATTLRIANFPAIRDREIKGLMTLLKAMKK